MTGNIRLFQPQKAVAVKVLLILFLIMPVPAGSLYAGDEFEFSGVESGGVEKRRGTGIPIHGRLSLESAWQSGSPDRWIRLGPSLNLVFDKSMEFGRFFFEGTGRFNRSYRVEGDSSETRDDHEFEPILREVYWKKNINRFTLSAGKLIDDPSVMDLVEVVDKVSVVNRAEAFFAEPEEIRQGQNLLKLSYYAGGFDAGLLFVPCPAFDRITDGGHPYAFVKGRDLIKKERRGEPEWGIQARKRFSKGALFGYAGRFNTRSPLLDTDPGGNFYKLYAPYWSAGGAFTLAVEPVLLKWEAAFNFDRPLQRELNGRPAGYVRYDQAEAAMGADLNLGDSGMVTLECSAASPLDRDEALAVNRTTWLGGASWSNDYLNDKLNISVTTLFPESFNNMVNRLQATYFFTDLLSVRVKYTRFAIREKGETYGFMDDYDRIGFYLNYDFDLE